MSKATVLSELRRTLTLMLPFFESPPALLVRSYGPGKWTARQILGHVTDTEIVYQARTRMILAEPGCAITPFDQDKWAKTLMYPQRDPLLMRRLFTSARECLIELVDLLPEAIFGREGNHPEAGAVRAWDIVGKAATHTMHHYGQLVAIREGTEWTPSPRAAE